MMPLWVSFRSKMRDNNTGPNSEMVARNRTPFCLEIVSNSTGKALGSKGKFIFAWRSSIKSLDSPACAMPLKSPFMSIIKTGMPLLESCSDRTWMVFVFPVPVAPAINPWRFRVFSGMFIGKLAIASPLNMAPPIVI